MFNMGSKDVSEYWELIALFSKMTSLYLFRCMGDFTTIRNNITMGACGFTDKEIADAATKANCDFLNDFEKPLDVSIGKEIYPEAIELSGGQSQRIALARCFLSRSSLILLDEPTAAIDPIFEKSLIAHLLEVMSAKTSVIVTHRLDITQFIDRIYVMEDGGIVESGNFNELMSKKSIFKDMYESQRGIKV